MPVSEFVTFRLFLMPCCSQLLCWLNPRIPNYCPECGKFVYPKMKTLVPLEESAVEMKLLEVSDEPTERG